MDTLVFANEKILWIVTANGGRRVPIKKIESSLSTSNDYVIEESNDDSDYKPSVFNYVLEKPSGAVIYNTLYNTLVRLSKREFAQYSKGVCKGKALRKALIQNGLWINRTVDERRAFIRLANSITYKSHGKLSVTITTTLKCNAHCPYCYEHGVRQVDMSADVVDRIFDFIKSRRTEDEIGLTWFGGEPLMNMQIMDSLCDRLTKDGIGYSSYIISNGSLFTEEIVSSKKDVWNLHDVQITLDGTRDYYEKTKSFDQGTQFGYLHTLDVIGMLARHGITVHVRMNISRENTAMIIELAKELNTRFANDKHVIFYPAFLTGLKSKMSEKEKLDFLFELMRSVSNPLKLTASSKFHTDPRTCACNNSRPNAFTIDVYGNVFSCEHNVGKAQLAMGNITENSSIKDPRKKPPYIRKQCRECLFFPKCYGGCKANLIGGDDACQIEKYIIPAYLALLK